VSEKLPLRDPLHALEQRIELVIAGFESGNGSSWADVEDVLTEGYGRVLATEAICVRLQGDGTADEPELEEFRTMLSADIARLRRSLGGFKTRGLEARRRFGQAG
jgi:hypothetical protein